jgi:N-acylneuraminate cytidylyltransferase
MNVAVIPARGGSKRIPRKNIKEFCGKPMIAWPIEEAKESGLFDHIIISTDDEEIAEVAKLCGAEVPFMREAELSDDYTGTIEVIAHAVSWMHEQDWKPEAVCCIYATSVFVIKDDLLKGFDALNTGKWQYAISVTDFEYPIFRSFRKLPSGGVEMFFPEHYSTRSQDLPTALHDAGQFCWGRPSAWLEKKQVFDSTARPILIPRWRVQDIDTEDDWIRAELLYKAIFMNE